jgi:hypothetical protein
VAFVTGFGVVLAGCFFLCVLCVCCLTLWCTRTLEPLPDEPELGGVVAVVVVGVVVVVTGGGEVVCGGVGLLVGGGGGGGGVPAYAETVSTEPTANSRNDAPTNPKKPLVFIYPRMPVRPGRRCTTSYCEQERA